MFSAPRFKSTEPSKKEAATKAGGGTTEEAKPETTEVVGDLYDWNRKQIEEAGITDQVTLQKHTRSLSCTPGHLEHSVG